MEEFKKDKSGQELSDGSGSNNLFFDLRNRPLLTAKQEKQLAERIERGDKEARNIMIESNLRLVVHIAKDYTTSNGSATFRDLVQEGTFGLFKAVDKFDHHKGFRFSTYAIYWIKQAIERSLMDKSRVVRVPAHMWEKGFKYMRAKEMLLHDLGREPLAEEIAAAIGESVDKVNRLIDIFKKNEFFDAPIKDEEEYTLLSMISCDLIPVDNILEEMELKEYVNSKLKGLSEDEEKILRLRFGFVGGDKNTLEDIGKIFGLTRERIRQKEAGALKILKKRMKLDLKKGICV